MVWHAKDIEAAAIIAVQSAYLTAGQRCTAARRLIVEDGKEEELIEAMLKLIDRLIVDEPFADPQPFMGPVIDLAAADHVQEQWLDLMMKGGKPLRRLDRPFEDRPYLTPALIDVTDVRDRPDEEIFGPVLQIIRVKDFDAAIDEANNTRFGLAASLVGGSPEMYDKFWANVRAGVINRNKPTNGAPSNAPFGGIGLPATTGRALLCRRLLRLSGDQQRSRPAARGIGQGCATRTCRKIEFLLGTSVDRVRNARRSMMP